MSFAKEVQEKLSAINCNGSFRNIIINLKIFSWTKAAEFINNIGRIRLQTMIRLLLEMDTT
jgi:hypothetical protein